VIGSAADELFYDQVGSRPVVEVNGRRLMSPAFYHRVESFQSIHLADHDAVAGQLPSDELHPVRWFDGRAAVMIWALRYHDVTITEVTDGPPGVPRLLEPYGEVGVIALVSRRDLPNGVPLLRKTMPEVGGFVLHLPVTTAEARDIGRVAFGLPKFVADMDFVETPRSRSMTLSEDDQEILTVTVHPRGPAMTDRRPAVMFSVLDGCLIQTIVPALGHRQIAISRRSGELRLGDHPVAESIRTLDVNHAALMVAAHLDYRMILQLGDAIGTAREEYAGYLGTDRTRGRLTVAYPTTGPIDQYETGPGVLRPLDHARTRRP
jgi:hypothetical protein